MNRYQKLKSLLLLLLVAVTAKAQISEGKVYNFVNVGKGTSMSVSSLGGVNVVDTDRSNYSQLWYAASDGNGFTLRNLSNGNYLKSPNATSNAWTMVATKDGNCVIVITITIESLEHLKNIINKLSRIDGVYSIERTGM